MHLDLNCDEFDWKVWNILKLNLTFGVELEIETRFEVELDIETRFEVELEIETRFEVELEIERVRLNYSHVRCTNDKLVSHF